MPLKIQIGPVLVNNNQFVTELSEIKIQSGVILVNSLSIVIDLSQTTIYLNYISYKLQYEK